MQLRLFRDNASAMGGQIYNDYQLGDKKYNNRMFSISDIAAITSGKDLLLGQNVFDSEIIKKIKNTILKML